MAQKKKKTNEKQSVHNASKKNTGVPFELAVKRIQQMLGTTSVVTHNEKMIDCVGNIRQCDVVVRGKQNGNEILSIVECRDHGRKKGPEAIEGFSRKCDNLRANVKILVSRIGFTPQALRLADHENVICLSLIPADPDQTGLQIDAPLFQELWEWESFSLGLELADSTVHIPPHVPHDVLVGNLPVMGWFERELATTYKEHYELKPVEFSVNFDNILQVHVNATSLDLIAIRLKATRKCTYYKRPGALFGDAVYSWQKDTLTIPGGGTVSTSEFQIEQSSWEPTDIETVFASNAFVGFILRTQREQFDPNARVIDLMSF